MYIDFDDMEYFVNDVLCNDKVNPKMKNDINYFISQFEEQVESLGYEDKEIESAVNGNQHLETSEKTEKRLRAFKKVTKEKLWEIVSQKFFIYGMAYAESLYIKERENYERD